jgi:hypothetical protein
MLVLFRTCCPAVRRTQIAQGMYINEALLGIDNFFSMARIHAIQHRDDDGFLWHQPRAFFRKGRNLSPIDVWSNVAGSMFIVVSCSVIPYTYLTYVR